MLCDDIGFCDWNTLPTLCVLVTTMRLNITCYFNSKGNTNVKESVHYIKHLYPLDNTGNLLVEIPSRTTSSALLSRRWGRAPAVGSRWSGWWTSSTVSHLLCAYMLMAWQEGVDRQERQMLEPSRQGQGPCNSDCGVSYQDSRSLCSSYTGGLVT